MRSRFAILLLAGLLSPDLGARQDDRALWRIHEETGGGRTPATAHRDASGKPRFVNALIRERSPYLLDAAHSPVDWLPYSDAAFAKARAQGKLVFVSIGYFSCHWCHVMARESFDDLGIAGVLSGGYVALKMDSEERPDVDRRFLARLEALGISPGWPMNFVLTPDDEVIWGATYIARDELLATLGRLQSRWKSDRPRLKRLAIAREKQVRSRASPASAQGSLADAFAREGARIAADFDPVHKGFGTDRKFPAPAELGFLRDSFLRGAGPEPGRMFVETVRAIAAGGLNDRIDGGVFRYSVARTWLQPHFEKMLYDQAQVSRLLCQGHAIAGDPALRDAATGILDFALSAFSTPSGLFASAFDAESEGAEGGYYLWSEADLARLAPEARSRVDAHFRRAAQSSGDFLLVPGGAVGADLLAPALEGLRAIRKTRRLPRRDDKAITAWNANMIAALAECGAVLGVSRYQAEAATRMRRLLEANAPGGRTHRYSIAGKASGPATIDDRGWVLSALVSLHDADGKDEWIGHARRLVGELMALDGKILDRELADFSRDRTGLSASAVLVQALSGLARRAEDERFAAARDRVSAPVRGFAGGAGYATLTAALHDVESPAHRPVAWAAQGKVRLSVERVSAEGSEGRFLVVADISPGWHVNSHRPEQDYLRPTRIDVPGVTDVAVDYPEGKPMRFGPTGDMLSVLEGSARFEVRIPAGALAGDFPVARMIAHIQACTDEICLRPETVALAGTRAGGARAPEAVR